jgi:hypothetical protein
LHCSKLRTILLIFNQGDHLRLRRGKHFEDGLPGFMSRQNAPQD